MNFTEKVKKGLSLEKDVFHALLNNKVMLLYTIIPLVLIAIGQAIFKKQALYKKIIHLVKGYFKFINHTSCIIFISALIIVVLQAAFIMHLQNRLSNRKTSPKEIIYQLLQISPWLIIWTIIQEGIYLCTRSLTADKYQIYVAVAEFIWKTALFYGLIIMITERENGFTALEKSIKTTQKTFIETMTGLVSFACMFGLVALALSFIFKVHAPAFSSKPPFFQNFFARLFIPNIDLLITVFLSLMTYVVQTTFGVLVYNWYKKVVTK